MRLLIFLVLVVVAIVAFVGYEQGWLSTNVKSDEHKTDVTVSVNKDRWQNDRDEYCRQAQTRLDDLKKQLDGLKGKAETAATESRPALSKAVDDLNRQYVAARDELKELNSATQERWAATKTKIGKALDDLQDGFHKAEARFR